MKTLGENDQWSWKREQMAASRDCGDGGCASSQAMGLLQPKTQGTVRGSWEKPCLKLKWHLVLYHTYTSQEKFTTRYTSIVPSAIRHAKLSERSREDNPSPHTFSSLQLNEKGKTCMDALFNNI